MVGFGQWLIWGGNMEFIWSPVQEKFLLSEGLGRIWGDIEH